MQRFISKSYRNLLISLLLVFLTYPVMVNLGVAQRILEFLFVAFVLLSGARLAYERTGRAWMYLATSAAYLLSSSFYAFDPDNAHLLLLRTFLTFVFLIMVAYLIFLDVFTKSKVSINDRLYGAMSLYLMIGMIFANLFLLINIVYPGSFTCGSCGQDLNYVFKDGDHVYFSFTTLTTTGYGDILATNPFAGMAATFEAIVGQMYTAIVIARLVGLHLMEQQTPNKKA
jgi:hypothetical protein